MPVLNYNGKKFADLTQEELDNSGIMIHRGMHINFNGNLLKMSKVEIISGEKEEIVEVWQRGTAELEEIVGDFEHLLNKAKQNIPSSPIGALRAVREGKLPDCGMYYLRDRGIANWYVENGWLWHEKNEGEIRRWALTKKYVTDGVALKESALEVLFERREFEKENALKKEEQQQVVV